jgi:hypothetical protein
MFKNSAIAKWVLLNGLVAFSAALLMPAILGQRTKTVAVLQSALEWDEADVYPLGI